jgi:S1-C subfamily serine protease
MSFLVDLSNELANAVERAGTSVIAVEEGGREGVSGTIWREGFAVTAEHTIRGRESVTVKLPSGERESASVIARDSGTDLALLKISSSHAPIPLADDSRSRVGEIVLSIGRKAEGLAASYGIISSIGGQWRTWSGARIDRWLRLDLAPFPGFSGGPVVTAEGKAVGVATSGPRGSAVTIPASTLNRVIDQLISKGRVARGYLGIGVQPIAFPEETASRIGSDRGLLVILVEPNGPAANAGIVLGDILVRIAGNDLRSARSLQPALDDETIGKPVKVDLLRGGQVTHLEVTIAEKPQR